MSRLNLSLLENAINFAEDALSNAVAAEGTPRRWKFAILSLVQSIELSLKELLRRQHPSLIYANVDKPDKTVGIEQAATRLNKIAGVNLTKDESSALQTAVSVRNNIVHHHVDEALDELKLVFARLLGFLNEFHRKHLEEALQDAIDRELWQSGAKIRAYGEELFRRATERMEADELDNDILISCPKCGWKALSAFGENQCKCYVCGHVEHLVICNRCNKTMIFGEHEEHNRKDYCWNCLCYITSDYWYEQAAGK